MDLKIFILLFTLMTAILARPGPTEETVEMEEAADDYEYEDEWTVQCGTHNQDGLTKDGVTTKEGEWPHACIIYFKDKIVGSASLIAPEIHVSAAHSLE